jgi:hypothetical protein
MLSPDGWVSTIAGDGKAGYADGPGHTARFDCPRGICVDGSGRVVVCDFGNNCIRTVAVEPPPVDPVEQLKKPPEPDGAGRACRGDKCTVM